MTTDSDGEMIVKIDHDQLGGLELLPDNSACGWWVRERDYHRYITAKSMATICYAELIEKRGPL